RNGLYSELNSQRIDAAIESGSELIFTRTQNPIVEIGLTKALIDKDLDFEVHRIYSPGIYGEMLTAEQPVVKDSLIQDTYDHLDYESGDAFVLMFKLKEKGDKE